MTCQPASGRSPGTGTQVMNLQSLQPFSQLISELEISFGDYRSQKKINFRGLMRTSEVVHITLILGNPMISSYIVRKLFFPIFTVTLECWVQILFMLNIFPVGPGYGRGNG